MAEKKTAAEDRGRSPSPNRTQPGGGYDPLPPPVRPLPRHIAFIMDGNGRWARRRSFPRLRGHEQGAESLRRITRYCARIGIREITFYALSTENYRRRPRAEVAFLMKLLKDYLIQERQELADGDIRLRAIGRTWELPPEIQQELAKSIVGSAHHQGMVLRLALNYGGRCEIIDAVERLFAAVREGRADPGLLERLGEEEFRRFLYDPEMSDPDLLIRTAGEARLSNFLLWQASYAEIWIHDVYWPDFDLVHLDEALQFYAARRRKFGGLGPEEAEAAEEREGEALPVVDPSLSPPGAGRAGVVPGA